MFYTNSNTGITSRGASTVRVRPPSIAAELLTNTDMSVIEASLECGFENSGYFIKLFKQKFGLTPLKWKNGKTSFNYLSYLR